MSSEMQTLTERSNPPVIAAGDAVHPATVFGALLLRDMRVARRELPYFLIRTALQPILMVTVFGFLLPKMGVVRPGYTASLLPGILAISLALAALQSVALPMVTDFGWTREIEDRLLAPGPTSLVAVEKVTSGIIQGLVAAAVVLPVARLIIGPIDGLSWAHLGQVIAVALLGGAAFSALGLWMGTAIPPQQIGLMFSVILAPMIFFGCAYYPWAGLRLVPAMKYAVLVNPMVYVAEGMRAALTPQLPHMPALAVYGALVLITALFMLLGLRSFDRKAMS
jgi:ABC-2 type transport system permease protein